jgi:hypothetical protein
MLRPITAQADQYRRLIAGKGLRHVLRFPDQVV